MEFIGVGSLACLRLLTSILVIVGIMKYQIFTFRTSSAWRSSSLRAS